VIGNRIKLDLYANVRPIRLPARRAPRPVGSFAEVWEPDKVDMVILRENTEGLYSGIGERAADAGDRPTASSPAARRAA
jgi:isocitrate/isopropylmalate dehydrogenase